MSIRTQADPPGRTLPRTIPKLGRLIAAGFLTALLALAVALPALAVPAGYEPGVETRLTRERGRALDDIRQLLAELPARSQALQLSGRHDGDRERIINRLLDLRGPELGTEPESMAIAAGLLDLLLADAGLREQPDFPRLVRASEQAQQLLLAAPPALRARTRARIQEIETPVYPDPGRPAATSDSPLRPGVTPLPRIAGEPVGSVLLEVGTPIEWAVHPDLRPEWIPGTTQLLLIDGARLRWVDVEGGSPPRDLGPIRPGSPVAISASGDYVAAATLAPGDSLDRLVLHRLGADGQGIILATGLRIAALAWSPGGARLAVAGAHGLEIRDLDRDAPPLRTTYPRESIRAGRTSLHWSPDGGRLLVVRNDPEPDAGGILRNLWHLALVDPRRGALLDSARVSDGVSLAWSPEGDGLWSVTRVRGVEGIDIQDDRFGPPRTVALPFDPESEPARLGLLGLAWSPDGRHLAIDAAPALPPGDEFMTYDNGLLPSSLFQSAGSRAALLSRTTTTAGLPPPARRGTFSPRGPFDARLEWHATSRWLLVSYRGTLGAEAALLLDRLTLDGRPLGVNPTTSATLSSDGRHAAWLESDPPGPTKLRVLRLVHAPRDAGEARRLANLGTDALNPGMTEEAVRSFRNAVRLAPDVASHRAGLGRAYRASAEESPGLLLQGYYYEAAARAHATAFLLDSVTPEVRVEFLETQTLRAAVAGQVKRRALYAQIERELRDNPGPTIYGQAAGNGAARIMDRLVAALRWDPSNESLRILYEGMAARWRDSEHRGR